MGPAPSCSAPEGRTGVYPFGGYRVRVHDDAATSLKVAALLADPEPSPSLKLEIMMQLLFCDPQGVAGLAARGELDLAGLLEHVVWETCGIDISPDASRPHEEPVFDWEADGPYIRASLFAAYGRPFGELAAQLTYRELCELVGQCPRETPMGQALYYRTAEPPKLEKGNARYVEEWRKARARWALKKGGKRAGDAMGTMDARASDAFAAFRR